jgi:hypothetical protein
MHTFPSSVPVLAASAAVIVLGIVGAVLVPSLMPNEKTLAEGTRLPVGGLVPGSFKLVPHPIQSSSKALPQPYILLIRTLGGEVHALYIPTRDGHQYLPESRPMETATPCESTEPNFQTSEIVCARFPTGFTPVARRTWSLSGKKLQAGGTDLQPVEGRVEDNDFVLFRPSAA